MSSSDFVKSDDFSFKLVSSGFSLSAGLQDIDFCSPIASFLIFSLNIPGAFPYSPKK